MIADPRLPVAVGTIAIVALATYIAVYEPAPGPLAAPHGRIERLSRLPGCVDCHADDGLEAGCLGCHPEIGNQLASSRGYHAFLEEREARSCEACHPEHIAANFPLTGPRAWGETNPGSFDHPHVEFRLEGAHSDLECEECHRAELVARSTPALADLANRRQSFLGLAQECESCHGDHHGSGLFVDCARCHDQRRFAPAARFDHAVHFPLDNAHGKISCVGCHESPALARRPAREPEGDGASRPDVCEGCHDSPHRTAWAAACTDCHPDDASPWALASASMTPGVHALTGFELLGRHVESDCSGCHPGGGTHAERFARAPETGDVRYQETCEACHLDVHRGQFEGSYSGCRECHGPGGFEPSTFTVARHSGYPLVGAHARVDCQRCHLCEEVGAGPQGVVPCRRFAGTSRQCASCHLDVHAGQFESDGTTRCDSCHSPQGAWSRLHFDHQEDTSYPLLGAHAGADCNGCHRLEDPGRRSRLVRATRRYRGTTRDCSDCHRDRHVGQFRADGRTDCARCHEATAPWRELHFDHDRDSNFPLDGRHRDVPCSGCHVEVELPSGRSVTQYKPLGKECQDCHAFSRG